MCGPTNATTDDEFLEFNGGAFQPASQEAKDVLLDPNNDRFNLPFKVVQPLTVGDIVETVNFAAENGVELSVKNSGHHYAGASTKKNSILIHTPSLPKFSGTSLEECTAEDGDISADLNNQACKLALARNCPATIHVGGGENFGELYTAVKIFNDNAGIQKYHPVGGAAATVTPMGWTWQGRLAGTQMGRTYGFGVDQVLQLEMVLADGSHVKFGPTEWEDADGYRYPKTTKVSGVCNSNPFTDDESEYVWEDCPNDINFDDLWFAVRGGGGGTWGIVVSTHLQLHAYPGTLAFLMMSSDLLSACDITQPTCVAGLTALVEVWQRFFLDLMLDPDSVTGVTVEQALKCGKPGGSPFCCYGDSGEAVMSAWTTRINEQRSVMINETGVPEALVDWAAANMTVATIEADYVTNIIYPEGHRLAGLGKDAPPPTWNLPAGSLPVIMPAQKALDIIEFLSAMDNFDFTGNLYFAHGENTGDQADSLSQPHREAGFMIFLQSEGEQTDYFLEQIFGGMDFNGDFPGVIGSNHMAADQAGPIKSDWTKPCPGNWTWEERAEKCFSPQEAVYGTQRVKRLEEIKAAVDPKGLFNCHTCISTPPIPSSSPSGGGSPAPSPPTSGNNPASSPPTSGNNTAPNDNGEPKSEAHVIRNVVTLGTIMMTLLLMMI